MSLLSEIVCASCGETKMVSHSASEWPSICNDCMAVEDNRKWLNHLSELRKLSLEERVERLEKIQFERVEPFDWNQRIG